MKPALMKTLRTSFSMTIDVNASAVLINKDAMQNFHQHTLPLIKINANVYAHKVVTTARKLSLTLIQVSAVANVIYSSRMEAINKRSMLIAMIKMRITHSSLQNALVSASIGLMPTKIN